MKNTEQELAELLAKCFSDCPNNEAEISACLPAAKRILSSGLVIPVSALDGMVAAVAIAIIDSRNAPYAQAQAAINAIKEEAGK